MPITKIPYVDVSWNITAGCTKCSPGCLNCWAEKWAHRLGCMGQPFYDTVQDEGRWNGIIELNKFILDKPFDWKNPRRIFVCSMSDLFHPEVPFDYIDKVMFTIYKSYKMGHTFLILTKRAKCMLKYFSGNVDGRILELFRLTDSQYTSEHRLTNSVNMLPRVQLGVSISNQEEMWKAKELSRIPAAVRWISFEPLLEDVREIPLTSLREDDTDLEEFGQHIDWVVVGCESLGQKAGRFQDGFIEAARSLVGQCQAANVPVYIKQVPINGKVSRNMAEWPKDLRVQQLAKKR